MSLPLTNTLHLYRALLRECTYLPDSQARTYLRDHVIRSFRRYLPRDPRQREYIPLPRQVSQLHRGRKGLSVLRRANQGYLRPLQNVFFLTYARKGRRRRELMAKLMQPATPSNNEAVEALLNSDQEKYSANWKPPAVVMALLRSQASQAENMERIVAGSNKLRSNPAIPKKNAWGRPMPRRRIKNLMHEWYVKQIGRLLPPLPEPEVQRLQALAHGKVGLDDGPRPRRTSTSPINGEEGVSLVDEKALLDGPQKSQTFDAYAEGRPHRLTSRFLQRLWAMILKHVPQMTLKSGMGKWDVKWDMKCPSTVRATQPSDEKMQLLFGPFPSTSLPIHEPKSKSRTA